LNKVYEIGQIVYLTFSPINNLNNNIMKHLHFVFLVIGVTLVLAGCSEDPVLAPEHDSSATAQTEEESPLLKSAKPAPKLIGATDCGFSFANPPIFWQGTVDFGDVGLYGLKFISYDPPRDFSQASPFYEDFIIYDLMDESIVYMKGWNAGVVTYANKDPEPVNFHANGKVTEAYGPLEGWVGRSVHIKGLVTWIDVGIPEGAKGTLRIN
jgi:hypothetical protein